MCIRDRSKGGAIYYNYVPPKINLTEFENNTAPYGKDLASYPYRIGLIGGSPAQEILIENVGSGIVLDQPLTLALMDHEGQVMNLENSHQITIISGDSSIAKTSGINTARFKNGIGRFDQLSAIAKPGSTKVEFIASSKAIDKNKISEIFGSNFTTKSIFFSFRFCEPGEEILGSRCVE